MSLIIDANCASLILTANPSPEFAPVMDAIKNNKIVMVRGGTTLTNEYKKMGLVWKFIVALDKAGKSIVVSDSAVDNIDAKLIKAKKMKSNDTHIIALAQISGARLLCSNDKALHIDFLDKIFIDNPRGSIYQNTKHAKLLKKCNQPIK